MMRMGTTADYARQRAQGHLDHFARLAAGMEAGAPDAELLADLEARHPLFPDLEFEVYA
jgi:predicted glycosyl hydrolase (DUF1957 family)